MWRRIWIIIASIYLYMHVYIEFKRRLNSHTYIHPHTWMHLYYYVIQYTWSDDCVIIKCNNDKYKYMGISFAKLPCATNPSGIEGYMYRVWLVCMNHYILRCYACDGYGYDRTFVWRKNHATNNHSNNNNNNDQYITVSFVYYMYVCATVCCIV